MSNGVYRTKDSNEYPNGFMQFYVVIQRKVGPHGSTSKPCETFPQDEHQDKSAVEVQAHATASGYDHQHAQVLIRQSVIHEEGRVDDDERDDSEHESQIVADKFPR